MTSVQTPVLQGRQLSKRYGHVVAMENADLELYPAEVLAVIGDNGAGKSTLIKTLAGAVTPDSGEILIDGEVVHFSGPLEAREHGIETVYQDLAVAPALDVATNLFLGREVRHGGIRGLIGRLLDDSKMRREARRQLDALGVRVPDVRVPVEALSGGQRQSVAVARAATFATKVVIMDEPTAALGVRESGMVLDLIRRIRDSGLPVILISHNMPHVFDVADRIHIHRLGTRAAIVRPEDRTMAEVVAIMTGAMDAEGRALVEDPHVEGTRHGGDRPPADA